MQALQAARLNREELDSALDQLVDGLATMTAEGYAHGDLSAYNLLWWQGRLWFIDFPQAVDIAANIQGLDFLHRDVVNVCSWFERRGVDVDAEAIFAEIITRQAAAGAEPAATSPAEFTAFIKSEFDKWARVVQQALMPGGGNVVFAA